MNGTCRRIQALTDISVELNFHSPWLCGPHTTAEQEARETERLCREINDHIRDHRSLDHVELRVKRKFEFVCSACSKKWEVAFDDAEVDTETNQPIPYCANCGATVTE